MGGSRLVTSRWRESTGFRAIHAASPFTRCPRVQTSESLNVLCHLSIGGRVLHVGVAAPPPEAPPQQWLTSPLVAMVAAVLAFAFTLIGSLVGGHLARRRRKELEVLSAKLRQTCRDIEHREPPAPSERLRSEAATVLASPSDLDVLPWIGDDALAYAIHRVVLDELRRSRLDAQEASLVCEASPDEAMLSFRNALENSLKDPSAAHPIEGYGESNLSLAKSRRQVSKLLHDARGFIARDQFDAAVAACIKGASLAEAMADKRAVRAVLRTKAKAQKSMRDFPSAIASLESALELSKELEEAAGDVDTLGTLADVYVELGDYETASVLYDRVIDAIKVEDTTEAATASWDC